MQNKNYSHLAKRKFLKTDKDLSSQKNQLLALISEMLKQRDFENMSTLLDRLDKMSRKYPDLSSTFDYQEFYRVFSLLSVRSLAEDSGMGNSENTRKSLLEALKIALEEELHRTNNLSIN